MQNEIGKEEICARLREADYPERMIEGVCTKLQNLTPQAKAVFSAWFASGVLKDDAFDIAGTTPRTIRDRSPEIKDIGIILTYDHLVRLVQRETEFLFTRDKSRRESAHKLSLMMAKRKPQTGSAPRGSRRGDG